MKSTNHEGARSKIREQSDLCKKEDSYNLRVLCLFSTKTVGYVNKKTHSLI